VYEADSYPHRSFALEVAISAVAQVAMAGITLTASAALHLCSRDSVRRWLRWIDGLFEPRDVERVLVRISPDMVPVALGGVPRVVRSLHLLDQLADQFTLRGVPMPRTGSGLARVLLDRLVRFGEVWLLTRPSPPLRADSMGLGGLERGTWTTIVRC
jgi:hypothetical protein